MKAQLSLRALLGTALACAAVAQAQDFPSKPVRIVVAFVPGGVQDALARAVAQDLGKIWNQSVIVDNRPSAGGIAAAQNVVNSAPDGNSILQAENMAFLTNEFLRKTKLSYDLQNDFAPVIVLASSYNLLAGSPNLPAKNLQELIALGRAKPGALNYGSFGIGSVAHINAEGLAAAAGFKATHVPYKGGAPQIQAIMANEVSFGLVPLFLGVPLVQQGRIKAIAYLGPERTSLLPEVPTISESGIKGFLTGTWFGWLAPAGTPKAVIDKIANDAGRVISAPAFRDKYLTPAGLSPVNAHGTKMWELLEADKKAFGPRMKALNYTVD